MKVSFYVLIDLVINHKRISIIIEGGEIREWVRARARVRAWSWVRAWVRTGEWIRVYVKVRER